MVGYPARRQKHKKGKVDAQPRTWCWDFGPRTWDLPLRLRHDVGRLFNHPDGGGKIIRLGQAGVESLTEPLAAAFLGQVRVNGHDARPPVPDPTAALAEPPRGRAPAG